MKHGILYAVEEKNSNIIPSSKRVKKNIVMMYSMVVLIGYQVKKLKTPRRVLIIFLTKFSLTKNPSRTSSVSQARDALPA